MGRGRGCSGARLQLLRRSALIGIVSLDVLFGGAVLGELRAQGPPPDALVQVTDRIRALEREAGQLAGQAKSIIGELRALELERDLHVEAANRGEAAATQARQALRLASDRMTALEQQRAGQLPQLKNQLVDIYKNGSGGYARLLFDVEGLRAFARATRAMSAIATINERRVQAHRRTLEALRRERDTLEQKANELLAAEAGADRARAAAERAVAAHTRLIEQIDSRRDLNAQYVGELQLAYLRLMASGPDGAAARTAAGPAVPIGPFRGALMWPVPGQVRARFGQVDGRLGGTAVRNGMEIAAGQGASVHAVHGGSVTLAEPFTGFGTMVIVDHGSNNYSVYGYLGGLSVQRGDVVDKGAELGRVGLAPSGPPALYFEMRIDGRSVDPLQWLQPR